jgi:hypothetical protein
MSEKRHSKGWRFFYDDYFLLAIDVDKSGRFSGRVQCPVGYEVCE